MDPATRYLVHESIKIFEAYFATKSIIQTQRQFRRDFPGRNAPIIVTILRLLNKFRETGSVQDKTKGHSGRPRSSRNDFNLDTVREHLAMSPRKSTRHLSQETDVQVIRYEDNAPGPAHVSAKNTDSASSDYCK